MVNRLIGSGVRGCKGLATLALGASLTLALGGSNAALAHEAHGHPARIHSGTCENLGGVAFRLNGVGGEVDAEGAPVATPVAENPKGAYQVMLSETMIDGSVADLLQGEHAVMIYESDEEMQAIACGNLGGASLDGTLVTGLAEARIPGHLGFAVFAPEGDKTLVTVMIGHGMAPVSASGLVVDDHDEGTADDHDESGADDHDAGAETDATPVP